jgi:hypothetical protein
MVLCIWLLLDRIDLQAAVTAARLPSSQMIRAAQAVRSLGLAGRS